MSKKEKIIKKPKIKKVNALEWILEPLESQHHFIQKKMFGCLAAYLDDRLVLVLADSEDPWNGILVPTDRDWHSHLQKEFPELTPHSVLGKWLYLPQTAFEF